MPLTEEQKSILTPEELAAHDEAEASLAAGGGSEEEDEAAKAAEAAEAEKAAEAAKAAAASSVAPSEADVQAAVRAALDQAARDRAEAERERTDSATEEEEFFEELNELQYKDPVAYHKKLLERARREITAEVTAEIDARYGDTNRKAQATEVASRLSSGLGAHGREFVDRYAPKIPLSQVDDPELRDLIARAARDYEREKTPRREIIERTRGEFGAGGDSDRQGADFWSNFAAKQAGIDPETLRLSDAELAEARRGA
jgi:hypothetical protein